MLRTQNHAVMKTIKEIYRKPPNSSTTNTSPKLSLNPSTYSDSLVTKSNLPHFQLIIVPSFQTALRRILAIPTMHIPISNAINTSASLRPSITTCPALDPRLKMLKLVRVIRRECTHLIPIFPRTRDRRLSNAKAMLVAPNLGLRLGPGRRLLEARSTKRAYGAFVKWPAGAVGTRCFSSWADVYVSVAGFMGAADRSAAARRGLLFVCAWRWLGGISFVAMI
jgi:hypothetical protein